MKTFRKNVKYRLIAISLFFLLNNFVNAQCSYSGTLDTTWAAPAAMGDSVFTNCIYGGKFVRVTGMIAGETYQVSTCGITNFDTQITIFHEGGGAYVAYNDDYCDVQSNIYFTPADNGNYDILVNEYSCHSNTKCAYLVVKKIPCPEIIVNYNISPNPACLTDKVNFNASGNGYTLLWNFGDGSPASNSNYISHTYDSVGIYFVSLQITNSCGRDTVINDTVNIENDLHITDASLIISPVPVCPNDYIQFVAPGYASSFEWNFGDGSPNSHNIKYTSHKYASTGNYNVWVKLVNSCGNDTILYDTVEVANDIPVTNANFDIYPNPVCPNTHVTFEAWGGSSFIWNFGDSSTTSHSSYTSHIYSSVGSYPVWVQIMNGCGSDTILYDTVVVNNDIPLTNAGIDVSPNIVCPNDYVYFDAWGNAVSIVWNFGDSSQTSNSQHTHHIYTSAGTYTAWVKMTNACGNDTVLYANVNVVDNLPITDVSYSISTNTVCPNDPVSYEANNNFSSCLWDFGDGSPISNSFDCTHSYASAGSYNVSLTVTNGCGNDTTVYDSVRVENDLPITSFDYYISQDSLCPNDPIYFEVWGSTFSSCLWNFGDGSPTSGNVYTQHTFTSAGNYTVVLTVTNKCGSDSTINLPVKVVNDLPITYANFTIRPDSVCPNNTVNFRAWGYASSFQWNFGDGSPVSHDAVTQHTYATTGNYSVSVTMTNGCGSDTTLSQTFHVVNNADPDPDDYDYGSFPHEPCSGDTAVFYISPAGSGIYLWDFGDSISSSSTVFYNDNGDNMDIVKHKYITAGNYTVNFTLTNGCGNSFTDSWNVNVSDDGPVDGNFWWNEQFPTVGENIAFFAFGGASYQWNFGDSTAVVNTTSSLTTVNHTYSSVGMYTITVIVTNSCGKSETLTDEITIDAVATGIQKNNISDNINFKIFPNPNNGSFSLEIENTSKENMLIEIINTLGQPIYSKPINNMQKTVEEIYLPDQPKGIYFVKMQSKNNISVKKLIIQ